MTNSMFFEIKVGVAKNYDFYTLVPMECKVSEKILMNYIYFFLINSIMTL